jgi:hypothetical protein
MSFTLHSTATRCTPRRLAAQSRAPRLGSPVLLVHAVRHDHQLAVRHWGSWRQGQQARRWPLEAIQGSGRWWHRAACCCISQLAQDRLYGMGFRRFQGC